MAISQLACLNYISPYFQNNIFDGFIKEKTPARSCVSGLPGKGSGNLLTEERPAECPLHEGAELAGTFEMLGFSVAPVFLFAVSAAAAVAVKRFNGGWGNSYIFHLKTS